MKYEALLISLGWVKEHEDGWDSYYWGKAGDVISDSAVKEIIEKARSEAIDMMLQMTKETVAFCHSGIPRCPKCFKLMEKESEHCWKPTCECGNKDVRLSIG